MILDFVTPASAPEKDTEPVENKLEGRKHAEDNLPRQCMLESEDSYKTLNSSKVAGNDWPTASQINEVGGAEK